jgi:hypothetical protein
MFIEFRPNELASGAKSGLADDILQNPILNRRRSRAATYFASESRQRTWPQEL